MNLLSQAMHFSSYSFFLVVVDATEIKMPKANKDIMNKNSLKSLSVQGAVA